MFPEILTSANKWICWKYETINGRKTKVPYNPKNKQKAKSIDPNTWGSYHKAMKAIGYNGIGYVFNGDGIFGIDIDHCINEETNQLDEDIKEMILLLDSYTEKSPSGYGIHIIGLYTGENKQGQRKEKYEMYFTGRYFTMTGQVILDRPIQDLTTKVEILRKTLFKKRNSKNNDYSPKSTKTRTKSISCTDQELLEKMFKWKNGNIIAALYRGENPISNGNVSSNDFYFVKSLNYANNNDIIQTDRIFRNSGRMRPKWDEKHYSNGDTYGQRLLQDALANGGA